MDYIVDNSRYVLGAPHRARVSGRLPHPDGVGGHKGRARRARGRVLAVPHAAQNGRPELSATAATVGFGHPRGLSRPTRDFAHRPMRR